jgi:hypothetical protein
MDNGVYELAQHILTPQPEPRPTTSLQHCCIELHNILEQFHLIFLMP